MGFIGLAGSKSFSPNKKIPESAENWPSYTFYTQQAKAGEETNSPHFLHISGPYMTMYTPIFGSSLHWAVDGDQDRDVQNTRYGRTVRISTPQLPFVVSFPGQNAQLVIQPAPTASRCAPTKNVFGSMERPCCQLSIGLFCFDFDGVRDRFHSLEPTIWEMSVPVRPYGASP